MTRIEGVQKYQLTPRYQGEGESRKHMEAMERNKGLSRAQSLQKHFIHKSDVVSSLRNMRPHSLADAYCYYLH